MIPVVTNCGATHSVFLMAAGRWCSKQMMQQGLLLSPLAMLDADLMLRHIR